MCTMISILYEILFSGNLHLNVTSPQYDTELNSLIEPFIYDWVAKYR